MRVSSSLVSARVVVVRVRGSVIVNMSTTTSVSIVDPSTNLTRLRWSGFIFDGFSECSEWIVTESCLERSLSRMSIVIGLIVFDVGRFT